MARDHAAGGRVEVLGVHPLKVTKRMITEQAAILYSDPSDSAALEQTREQLESAVLIEVLIHRPDKRFQVGDFTQRQNADHQNDQAPWNEHFLNNEGTALAGNEPDQVPQFSLTWRVAFFLHFFAPDAPLETSYGRVLLPAKTPMPPRLRDLVPYEYLD